MCCCEQRGVLWSHQRSVLLRPEESAVAPPEECCVANTGECCVTVLRTDNVAAPKRNLVNLADLVENRFVFDENWGVLDKILGPAGLPALPAFPPNIIPK